MHITKKTGSRAGGKIAASLLGAVAAIGLGLSSAHATSVKVTVTNTASEGGITLTPFYFGFHDGTTDLFDVGERASAGIEAFAEVGQFGLLRDERLGFQSTSVGGAAFGTDIGAPGPLDPGESASFMVDLDSVQNRFLFFASMLLPSNDTFVGVDDTQRFSLFDDDGKFLGDQTIDVTGEFAYDAGTEVNDAGIDGGAPFVVGRTATEGADENGVIHAATSLADFIGLDLATGGVLSDDVRFDLDPENFLFAQIQIQEVPIPPAMILMAAGVAGLSSVARRRKSRLAKIG